MSSVDTSRARLAREEEQRRAANHAALTGALLAFPKPNASPTASAPVTTLSPVSGASAAAAKTWKTKHAGAPPQRPSKPTSLSTASTGAIKAHKKSQENLLISQDRETASRTSSPSHAAASLAALNYQKSLPAPNSVQGARPNVLPRRFSGRYFGESKDADVERLPEPGTVKDVKKWLQALENSSTDGPPSELQSLRRPSDGSSVAQSSRNVSSEHPRPQLLDILRPKEVYPPPVILSPKPVRAVSAAGSIDAIARHNEAQQTGEFKKPPVPRKDARLRSTSLKRETLDDSRSGLESPESFRTPPESVQRDETGSLSRASSKPAVPPPRRSKVPVGFDSDTLFSKPSRPTVSSAEQRPILPPRTQTDTTEIRATTPTPSLQPRPSFDATSSSSSLLPTTSQSSAPNHRPSLDIPRANLPMRRVSPSLSTSSLANAIVASSLASSRTASPTKPSSPAPSLPTRPSSKFHLPFSRASTFDDSTRATSPAKPAAPQKYTSMRKTMRDDSSSSSDEAIKGRKGRNKLMMKHPHKHHEGTKKRWADSVTTVERKRYEGVWAANRLLLLPNTTEYVDCVHGYVVRDVWARSRLPWHVLEEVWELVQGMENGGRGWGLRYLGRTEFVVGLWLIDQTLKGRKLPVRVGRSVWESARGVGGVKVPGYK